ncbi:MAG: hypothetical protein V4858_17320 [Pseudomonadota bacterium]
MEGEKYYFFEYDRPGKKPGVTRWRMTIADAKERHGDAYRPILDSLEIRSSKPASQFNDFKPYEPGTGPKHRGTIRGNKRGL